LAPPAPNKKTGKKPDPYVGRVVDRRFTILSRIGRGGMGLVYRARQSPLERNVALKVLVGTGEKERESEFQKRFFREAATAARLKHPNTITVFDYGSDELDDQAIYWIAMELLEGRTLSRALSRGGLEPARVVHIALQICRSLREAHAEGIVHRDLKPGNIMLIKHEADEGAETEFVKVLDFGLAKTFEGPGEPALTRAGTFLGSPRYVAPEQIEGRPVDQRTDIYSFGCVLYRMITGTVPYDGETPVEIMMKHLKEEPEEIGDPSVPDDLVDLCLQCLEKRANMRPDSMQAVITQLKRIRGQLQADFTWEEDSDVAPIEPPPTLNLTSPTPEARAGPAPEMSDPDRAAYDHREVEVEHADDDEHDYDAGDDYEPGVDDEPTHPQHNTRSTGGEWVGQVPLDDTRPSRTVPQRKGTLTAFGLFLLVVGGAALAVWLGRELGWFDAIKLPPAIEPLFLDEDRLELLEVLENDADPVDDRVQRVLGDEDRQLTLFAQQRVEVADAGATAAQHDAAVDDVGRQLRRGLLERRLHGADQLPDVVLQRLAHLDRRHVDRARDAGDEVAPLHLDVELFVERVGVADLQLDQLGRALADEDVVALAHEVDDRLVELVARHAQRLRGDEPAERDHRDVGRAAADVDDHRAARVLDGQPGTDGRRHGLLDQIDLAHAGAERGLAHRLLLDRRDLGGHRDDQPAAHEVLALDRLLDERADHRLGDGEVGDDAVAHGPDGDDVARRLAEHLFGVASDREHARLRSVLVDGDDAGLVEHDAAAAHVYQRVGGAKIDREVDAEEVDDLLHKARVACGAAHAGNIGNARVGGNPVVSFFASAHSSKSWPKPSARVRVSTASTNVRTLGVR
jgi:serine/threonine protein kinase